MRWNQLLQAIQGLFHQLSAIPMMRIYFDGMEFVTCVGSLDMVTPNPKSAVLSC